MDRKSACLIVVPTYNEIENIERLISEIGRAGGDRFDILFVDDNSPDGTGQLIEKIRLRQDNIFALHRQGKMGLGSAYLDGFQYGVKRGYDYIFEMDADLSHEPKYLPEMLEKLNDFDIVVSSRFMGNLRNINTTPFRILTSLIAAIYMRLSLGLTCSDPMAGFVGYRRRVLEGLEYPLFFAKGYAFQAEVKYRCKTVGFRMAEIPIAFKARKASASKMSKKDIIEAMVLPWKIRK